MLTSLPLEITALRNADLDISFNGLKLLDWSLSSDDADDDRRISTLPSKLDDKVRIARKDPTG